MLVRLAMTAAGWLLAVLLVRVYDRRTRGYRQISGLAIGCVVGVMVFAVVWLI